MKRATLLLEDELYRRAKALSKTLGTTLREVINHLIREGLHASQSKERPKSFKLPVHKGLRPHEGVDLADRGSLYDIMDERSKK